MYNNYSHIVQELSRNSDVFKSLLNGISEEEYLWKSAPEKWCLLEIICHLHDEEREDFRARTKRVLENPKKKLEPFDPLKWVEQRNYLQKNYDDMLNKFLEERKRSVAWLDSLISPRWENAFNHPELGLMTAKLFLTNWLAHDYLHIRQINKLKFDYLQKSSGESLNYAGNW